MRSGLFVALSLGLHALTLTLLVLSPQHLPFKEAITEAEVEVALGAESEPAPAPIAKPEPAPEPKPAVKAPAPKPVAKPVAASNPVTKPQPVAATVPTAGEPADLPENLDPEIEDEPIAENSEPSKPEVDAADIQEPSVKLIPVTERLKDVSADTATEAQSQDSEVEDPAPVQAAAGTGLGQAGATKEVAVSHLNLKQAPANRGPVYPINARREGRQGEVELLYRITKDGKVTDVQIAKSSGHQDLDNEAVRAIAKFKFVPGQEGWARHPVLFTLTGQAEPLPSRLRRSSARTE